MSGNICILPPETLHLITRYLVAEELKNLMICGCRTLSTKFNFGGVQSLYIHHRFGSAYRPLISSLDLLCFKYVNSISLDDSVDFDFENRSSAPLPLANFKNITHITHSLTRNGVNHAISVSLFFQILFYTSLHSLRELHIVGPNQEKAPFIPSFNRPSGTQPHISPNLVKFCCNAFKVVHFSLSILPPCLEELEVHITDVSTLSIGDVIQNVPSCLHSMTIGIPASWHAESFISAVKSSFTSDQLKRLIIHQDKGFVRNADGGLFLDVSLLPTSLLHFGYIVFPCRQLNLPPVNIKYANLPPNLVSLSANFQMFPTPSSSYLSSSATHESSFPGHIENAFDFVENDGCFFDVAPAGLRRISTTQHCPIDFGIAVWRRLKLPSEVRFDNVCSVIDDPNGTNCIALLLKYGSRIDKLTISAFNLMPHSPAGRQFQKYLNDHFPATSSFRVFFDWTKYSIPPWSWPVSLTELLVQRVIEYSLPILSMPTSIPPNLTRLVVEHSSGLKSWPKNLPSTITDLDLNFDGHTDCKMFYGEFLSKLINLKHLKITSSSRLGFKPSTYLPRALQTINLNYIVASSETFNFMPASLRLMKLLNCTIRPLKNTLPHHIGSEGGEGWELICFRIECSIEAKLLLDFFKLQPNLHHASVLKYDPSTSTSTAASFARIKKA